MAFAAGIHWPGQGKKRQRMKRMTPPDRGIAVSCMSLYSRILWSKARQAQDMALMR